MNACDYSKVCTPGPSAKCGRVKDRTPRTAGSSCLCECHQDGLFSPKDDGWKPSEQHNAAIDVLQVFAESRGLFACDPGGECYFPRCLADGCEAEREEQ